MKIAVIVTTYNRPDALVKVLDGLLHQSRLPDEIIIADDGSKESTQKAILPFLDQKSAVVSHVWQEDKGFRLATIRNKAISKATSDYLILLDGDCIPGFHFVKDHFLLAKTGCFFQGKRVIVSKNATPDFDFERISRLFNLIADLFLSRISNGHHIFRLPLFIAYTTTKMSGVRGCNMGFFRTDLLAVNGFNEDFKGWGREDSEIVARLYKYGLKRREHPFRAICFHLWHNENTRAQLEKNDQLLEQALESDDYTCERGIRDLSLEPDEDRSK